jgi:hypothetical protein
MTLNKPLLALPSSDYRCGHTFASDRSFPVMLADEGLYLRLGGEIVSVVSPPARRTSRSYMSSTRMWTFLFHMCLDFSGSERCQRTWRCCADPCPFNRNACSLTALVSFILVSAAVQVSWEC